MINRYKEGDKVRTKRDYFGQKKGDIGTIVSVRDRAVHIVVEGRESTSGLKPAVSYTLDLVEPAPQEEIINTYSIF